MEPKIYSALEYRKNGFSADVENFKKFGTHKMGFSNMDDAGFRLYSGLYVIGGNPIVGTTAFCSQLVDQIAEAGRPVLYFSLAMSRFDLVSRSLSRVQDPKKYDEKIAPNIFYVEGDFSLDTIKSFIDTKKQLPTVIIDCPHRDENVIAAKLFADENGLAIILTNSFKRGEYLTPADFNSFGESEVVDYAADCLIGLQLMAVNADFYVNDETFALRKWRKFISRVKNVTPRLIQACMLKNNFGLAESDFYFEYDPEHNKFSPLTHENAKEKFIELEYKFTR